MNRDALQADRPRPTADLTRDSPFSYACRACSRCCHDYYIAVNPHEVTLLARHLGMSTTSFAASLLAGGPFLRREASGACTFLGPRGCTVHAARPLVCRLYPLGREVSGDGSERFLRMTPHPQTAGEYGRAGTVDDFLRAQGALPLMEAADEYSALLADLIDVMRTGRDDHRTELGDALERVRTEPLLGFSDWLDPDRVLAATCPDVNTVDLTAEDTTRMHLEQLRIWITQLQQENIDEHLETDQ